jgi:hypothetical protein
VDPEPEPESELEPLSGAVVEGPLLDELSVWAYATAAPLPSMIPARAHPAATCLSRLVMSFTSLRCFSAAACSLNLKAGCDSPHNHRPIR